MTELNKSEHSINFIQSLNPSICILEPTGVYSRFWIDNFERLEIPYLLANQTIVKDTRKALGCGKITSQSGQSSATSKKSAGAARIHSALVCYVWHKVEIGMGSRLLSPEVPKLNNRDSLPKTRVCQEIRADHIKRGYNLETLQKKQKLQLLSARSATARKVAEVLFNRLYQEWCNRF